MTALRILGVALGVLVLLELASAVLIWLLGTVRSRTIWRRRTLLATQAKKLDRLANASDTRARIHPVLGWDYKPDFSVERVHINSLGLRSSREYAPTAPPGVVRVAAFGDSFTFAGEVTDEEAWPARMEQGWNVEVLNYGVGAYGPDQVYLRYLAEGEQMKPDIVLVGFISLMATRVVSRYRGFQTPLDGPWFKPRFVLDGDDLRLVPPPVASREDALRLIENPDLTRRIGELDHWYVPAIYEHALYDRSATYRLATHVLAGAHRRYLHPDRIYKGPHLNPSAEAYQILVRLYRKFGEAIRANGAEPVVMMCPTRRDLELRASTGRTSYTGLANDFAKDGLRVVDLAGPLAASGTPPSQLYARGGHPSANANVLIARAVADALNLTPRREGARADA